jgi:CelD/BcsL family acetyltransferase involved in cellulose biosynthesis
MNVTVVKDFSEFLLMEKSWGALANAMEQPSIFLTHAWIRIWWENFRNNDSLYILLVWEKDELVGILPLRRSFFRRFRVFHWPAYFLLTSHHTLPSNILCRLDLLAKVLEAIRVHLETDSEPWDKLVFKNVPTDSGTVDAIAEGFTSGKMRSVVSPWQERNGSYYIDMDRSFADYFSGLGAVFRKNRKYIHNVMARRGKIEFAVEHALDPASIQQFYEIEDTGWKHVSGAPLNRNPLYGKYFMDLAKMLAKKGMFRLCSLRYAGDIIAMVYGMEFKGTFHFLKLAVDYNHPETRRVAPGQVIQYYLLQYCFENGYIKSDFLGGCDHYESHWTKKINRKMQITICYRRTSAEKAWFIIRESTLYAWNKITNRLTKK